MAVTLEQFQLNMQDDIQAGVIDEFRKSSVLLDNLTFDDAVSPGTSGGTMTYGYQRLLTESGAGFRKINGEYDTSEATKERFTTELKIFGGAFEIDRIIAKNGGLVDELGLQMSQKIKAAKALFHDTAINGSSATDEDQFDGLDVALTGSITEYGKDTFVDLSSSAKIEENAQTFQDELDLWLSSLDAKPSMLAGNSRLITKIKSAARRSGYYSQTEDAFGRKTDSYDGIVLVDLGAKPGSNSPVVPIETRTVGGAETTGLTDLYAIRFGLDAFHGVSLANNALINTILPDFTTAGAVKKGEVEMVASVVLKKQNSCGVFRNIKVQ